MNVIIISLCDLFLLIICSKFGLVWSIMFVVNTNGLREPVPTLTNWKVQVNHTCQNHQRLQQH